MSHSPNEELTYQFYSWETMVGRGYYHAPFCVDIEPPYKPFQYQLGYSEISIDDGSSPLIKRIGKLLNTPKGEEEPEEAELTPTAFSSNDTLSGWSISFPKGYEISSVLSSRIIENLCYSQEPLSFEIYADGETIMISIICSLQDSERVQTNFRAFFPDVILTPVHSQELAFKQKKNIAIHDFGLSDEFILPIATHTNFSIDPLTPIIALFNTLKNGETTLIQILFKGVTAPWKKDIMYAVSNSDGTPLFDAPELFQGAQEKTSSSLFAVVLRSVVQGSNDTRTQYLSQELARSMCAASRSEYNQLIPLSNEDYPYLEHLKNVYNRTSNRLGMLLNTDELVSWVHYPNRNIVSYKLHATITKTKKLPDVCMNQKYVLGVNSHNKIETPVYLHDEQRLRHTHIIGATGVGKSTLIVNMALEDIKQGNGCALFDPHGDLVDDVLLRIPEERKDDVILIDPSDTDFPIGFNLLEAHSEAEKMVLSSDLVSAFKRHATAWGDNMTAVLSNTIHAFLESNIGGTLIELKRFLLEEDFRNEFLESVDDGSIHYYWKHEYPMVKKGIAPLLTRIDTFLRPKIVRYMLAQKQGIDFSDCITNNKIVLIKLSQGLIGTDNSFLLASLFIAKFYQVAQNRQNISKQHRHPYYIYLDEFHNFVTPSLSAILSGARKYGLGLILAHQDLAQIEDNKILNSVLSNPYIRICFRLGDADAHKLASGFSFFEQNDLQNLSVGQAIIRVGSSENDCNLTTYKLPQEEALAEYIKQSIIHNSRTQYAKPKEEVQKLLDALLPKIPQKNQEKPREPRVVKVKEIKQQEISNQVHNVQKEIEKPKSKVHKTQDIEKEKQDYLKSSQKQISLKRHRSLQNTVTSIAQSYGYRANKEEETTDGGRVDVGLRKNNISIAVEISVGNTAGYEVQNITKCLNAQYSLVFVISDDTAHLQNIQKKADDTINSALLSKVFFLNPNEFTSYLTTINEPEKKPNKRVKGWRVNVNYQKGDEVTNDTVADKIRKALK